MIPEATCLVCGESVSLLMAPLHVEDHKARGEFPDAEAPRFTRPN